MIRLGRPRTIAILWSVALIAVACSIERADVRTPSGEPPEADTTRVRKVLDAMTVGFETGDLSALDTIYHDSVTVYEGGDAIVGWARYRDEHLVPEIESLTDRRLRFEGVTIRLVGSTAWITCRYSRTAIRDGEDYAARGVATLIFRKLAGRWRLVHSHTSKDGG